MKEIKKGISITFGNWIPPRDNNSRIVTITAAHTNHKN
jgi:hypothetical protein